MDQQLWALIFSVTVNYFIKYFWIKIPSIFIGGFSIGGLDELETLEATGNLKILLNNLKITKLKSKNLFKQCICLN